MPVGQFTTEVQTKYSEALGTKLGPVYIRLVEEVIWLHVKWREYRKLYATSEERVTLLNKTAGFFFQVMHDVLLEDVFLHIARLTDNIKTMNKPNLTITRLPLLIEDHELRAELTTLVESTIRASNFAKDWRNRQLAHRDLNLALDHLVVPLPAVSRQQIEEALHCFRSLLNKIEDVYLHAERDFSTLLVTGDADDLMNFLNAGHIASERSRNRIQQGHPLPEDFEIPPSI